jgi:hypothetical protein
LNPYHAQLIPIVAIAFGPVVPLLINRLPQLAHQHHWWLPVAGALLLAFYFNFREVKETLGSQRFESKRTAQQSGEIVVHSSKVVYLAPYYGMSLQYYGELSSAYWFRRLTYYHVQRLSDHEQSIEERLLAIPFTTAYFVITDFKEFQTHHADLREFLVVHCTPVAKSDQYLIYDGSCIQ